MNELIGYTGRVSTDSVMVALRKLGAGNAVRDFRANSGGTYTEMALSVSPEYAPPAVARRDCRRTVRVSRHGFAFAGRSEQIEQLLTAIGQVGQHAILYGERGVGKTSLASLVYVIGNETVCPSSPWPRRAGVLAAAGKMFPMMVLSADSGSGGGGGVLASPLGFIELQNGAATFRRVHDPAGYWPLVVAFWMFARGLRIIFRK